MDEVLPIDPWSSEFVEAFFLRRLKAVALRLCSGNLDDAMDLLDDTAGWFYSWKPWTKGIPYEEWFPYSVTVMKRIHYRGSKDEPPMDQLDGEMEERVGSDDSSAVKDIQYVADRKSLGSKVMPLFDEDKQMQDFIYYRYFCDMTRAEVGKAMGLSPRQVTNLEARFTYRVTPEVAIKYLGLVPREQRV